jgi:putative selenate reductase
MRHYFDDLEKRMAECGAGDLAEFELRGQGQIEPDRVKNTRAYLDKLLQDPRYLSPANQKAPPKVGTKLWLFDCLTCDKCIPVCPNDANFTYPLPKVDIPVVKLHALEGGGFRREEGAPLKVAKKHQVATFADLCNECGNCDVFCPEDGGPYVLKPRFFGSEAAFLGKEAQGQPLDGVFVARGNEADTALARFEGRAFKVEWREEQVAFSGPGFDVRFAAATPEALEGHVDAGATVDLTYFRILDLLRRGVLDEAGVNYVNV